MQMHTRPGEITIRFGSRFDAHEVSRVAEAITAFAPVSTLTLDFAATREFRDAAVALLAAQVAVAGARLHLRGLTRHQTRMFRYFGHVTDGLAADDGPGADPA